jgi:hypothetical protein
MVSIPAVAGVVALVGVALAGCKAVYAPNMAHAPLLQHQGELRGTVDIRNVQLAYAVASHVGLMANAYFRSEDNSPEEDEERQEGSGSLLELGAGYFTFLDEPKWLELEIYGGAGVGSIHHEITPSGGMTRTFDAEGVRLFLQPAAGVSTPYFDVAVSARLVAVAYTETSAENYTPEDLEGDRFAGLEDTTWMFLEPAITVRGGYKWVKLQFQFGRSIKLNGGDLNRDPGMLSLGLHVDLFRVFDRPAQD